MTLKTHLDAMSAYDAEYDGDLSNHLPMALAALHALGADDARLDRFAVGYAPRLPPAPPAETWPSGDAWPGRLGDRSAWPVYRSFFAEWLRWDGLDDLLQQVLPVLMPGCGAAAFHGLIRTAYGARFEHPGEVADGLAYWACRWLPLGDLQAGINDDGSASNDPVAVLQDLRPVTRGPVAAARLISEGMHLAAQRPGFRRTVGRLRVDDGTLTALARHAAALYAGSGNFTVLHLVTGCHALRVLQPFMDDPQPAVRWFWQAYAAGHVASAMKPAPALAAPLPEWSDIVAQGIASDDEHVIKVVDSCREQEAALGGEEWRRAAARAVC